MEGAPDSLKAHASP